MGLRIREILKCASGLLNPNIPSNSFTNLDSYTRAAQLDDSNYFCCSSSSKLASDSAILMQTFLQLSGQITSPQEIADQFTRAMGSIAENEYNDSTRNELPMHISASAEAYVGVRRMLQSHAGKALEELDAFTKDAHARIKHHLSKSFPNNNVPQPQCKLVELYHNFMYCLSEVFEDKFPARLGSEPRRNFRSLLASHPVLCGIRLFYSRLHLQGLALESSNVRQGTQLETFLYLALLEEGEITSTWQDMEFLLSQLGSQVVLGGKRPSKGQDFLKRLRTVVNWSSYVQLVKNKRLGHGYSPISRLLMNRIISQSDDAATLSFDDLELLLAYLDALESESKNMIEPQQDASGFFSNRADLWKNLSRRDRMSPPEFLESFSRHFTTETPGLLFDWLAFEERIWDLANKIEKAFDAVGITISRKKSQFEFESAKFVLVEIVDSTLFALKRKLRGSATPQDLERVRVVVQVLSRFIRRHGDEGVKVLEQEQEWSTPAHLDTLPEAHLKEFRRRIEQYGMDSSLLEQLETKDNWKDVAEALNIVENEGGLRSDNGKREDTTKKRTATESVSLDGNTSECAMRSGSSTMGRGMLQ